MMKTVSSGILSSMPDNCRGHTSLSLRRGVRKDITSFIFGGKPIKSLGRQYTDKLSEIQIGITGLKHGLMDSLAMIVHT